jgi:hypothetical protein
LNATASLPCLGGKRAVLLLQCSVQYVLLQYTFPYRKIPGQVGLNWWQMARTVITVVLTCMRCTVQELSYIIPPVLLLSCQQNMYGKRKHSCQKTHQIIAEDVESLQISLHSYPLSLVQWTNRLLPVTRDPGSNSQGGGVLMWNRDSPVSVVSLHWWPWRDCCSLVWGELRPKPSLGPRTDNVIIPLDLTQLFCPGFTLTAGPPSSFTTDRVGCWGGALWRASNLTSFSPCLTGPVNYLFASRHKGPGFKTPGGVLMWNRISC